MIIIKNGYYDKNIYIYILKEKKKEKVGEWKLSHLFFPSQITRALHEY